ncbi:MAG: HD domain-containing phosphohydrolase [Candidatus Woesearchaeota archaeon]
MRLEAEHILDKLEISDERRKEIAPRINYFVDLFHEENLQPLVDARARELTEVIKDTHERIPRLYSYLDDVFKNFMPAEGSGHSKIMFAIAAGVASRLEFSTAELKDVGYGAVLHDLGKLALPGRLMEGIEQGIYFSMDLYELMSLHVFTGYLIVDQATENVPDLRGCAMKPLCHQEEIDGNGPLGLVRDEIFLVNKIIRVVDSYLAISNARSYDPITPHDETIEEVKRSAGYDESELDLEILEWSSRSKLDQILKRYQHRFGEDDAESLYHNRLIDMIKRNTRNGVRIPEGIDYNELLKAEIIDLEDAYVKLRLTPENQFSRMVVDTFIEFLKTNSRSIEKMLESPIIYPS